MGWAAVTTRASVLFLFNFVRYFFAIIVVVHCYLLTMCIDEYGECIQMLENQAAYYEYLDHGKYTVVTLAIRLLCLLIGHQ